VFLFKLGAEESLPVQSTQQAFLILLFLLPLSIMPPPVSSEEISLIDHLAKFEGLKELLEDDIEETNPAQSVFSNVGSNHPPFKQLYLDLRVAYRKYKSRFVPSSITEVDFNDIGSPHKYNDPWLDTIKKEFQRVNNDVVTFLDSRTASASSSSVDEQKFNLAAKAEVDRILSKIRLESRQ
jgi:hypothetical protein